MKLCLCSHRDLDHPGGWCIRAGCGCGAFRLAPVRDEPGDGEDAATGGEAG